MTTTILPAEHGSANKAPECPRNIRHVLVLWRIILSPLQIHFKSSDRE